MKKSISCFLLATSVSLIACQEEEKEAEVTLDTLEKKVSYAIGASVAQNVRVDQFAFDSAAFVQAVEDVKAGKESRLSEEETRDAMQAFQAKQREAVLKERAEQEEKNRAEGLAFLGAKELEEGVVKTGSGLMYKIITEGSGEKPGPSDSVKAHYRGTLLDGTEFDSSFSRGQPATFGVSNLIPGWVEALQLMPVGSKWELYIPSDLAYGPRGNQGIPPSATLIFELELLEILGQDDEEESDVQEEKSE